MNWDADLRPVWWVRVHYVALREGDAEGRRKDAARFEDALSGTGTVRHPCVAFDGVSVTAMFQIKADGPGSAVAAASQVMEAADRVSGLALLGDPVRLRVLDRPGWLAG